MSDELRGLPVLDLLRLQARAVEELRHRGVVRTRNGPVGDYGEHLFARAFGWTLEANSKAGYDARDATGTLFQIKARRVASHDRSRQLGVIRKFDEARFAELAVVLFDEDFAVLRAGILPHAFVAPFGRRDAHQNGLVVFATDHFFAHAACRDVTVDLRAAQLRD